MNETVSSASQPPVAATLIDLMFGSDAAALPLVRMLQRPVIIDANVLIEDALRLASGRHCALQVAAQMGTARLLAPPQILWEVERNLRKACGSKHDPEVVLAIIRDQYLPHIRIVDVSDISIADRRVAALQERHAPDVAYAVLALTMAPSALLTNDRDILDQGLGHYHDRDTGGTGWTYGAVSLQDAAVMPIGILGLTMSVAGTVTLASATADLTASLRSRRMVMVGAAAVATGVLAVAAKSGALSVSSRLKEAGEAVRRVISTGLAWWGDATKMLDEGAVTPRAPIGPTAQLARLLALSRTGLTVDELAVALPELGDHDALLASSLMFVQSTSGRWSVGEPAVSWLRRSAF